MVGQSFGIQALSFKRWIPEFEFKIPNFKRKTEDLRKLKHNPFKRHHSLLRRSEHFWNFWNDDHLVRQKSIHRIGKWMEATVLWLSEEDRDTWRRSQTMADEFNWKSDLNANSIAALNLILSSGRMLSAMLGDARQQSATIGNTRRYSALFILIRINMELASSHSFSPSRSLSRSLEPKKRSPNKSKM